MASFTQLNLSLTEPIAEALVGRAVHQPTVKDAPSVYDFKLVGWVVGRHAPVVRVELVDNGTIIQSAAVEGSRANIASRLPQVAWSGRSGWLMIVDSLALEPTFACELRAAFADGTTVPLATIEGQRQPLPKADAQYLQPLMVTGLGRSGTTWLMRLLAEHPAIVAYRRYPYEMRPGLYWTHMLKVLSGLPDYSKQMAQANRFFADRSAVGPNPFHGAMLHEVPRLQEWSGRTYVDSLARFCHDSIEGWYRCVAAGQQQPDAAFFAEKQLPNEFPVWLWEMYPAAREIVLVRDFRDVASSVLAFNAKRGFDDFGRQRVASDEEYLHQLQREAAKLLESWVRRADRAHLVRYEELLTKPHDTLRAVLAYTGLESSPATIDGMIERASRETPELQRHQTSESPEASIGRWRRDLDPSLQAVATDTFHDLLTKFGYDPNA